MTLTSDRSSTGSGPQVTPRLRLKPKAPTTGYVDGAWWPHSSELVDELPDLLAVLSVRLGIIQRVLYNLGEWTATPRRFSTGGTVVRLDGYTRQPADTVEVMGRNAATIHLLVIPPGTDPDRAHDAMMSAAAPGNGSTSAQLLSDKHS
ncbi:DUF5994 family protein [Mycobacterium paraterrae]|uniref:DUF5994 family protein n=1 Tax=Mycobacterium paraterrae TaxID=577492 RepID=A0ABY3VQ88_9MYCO|nr:DUF5994 family protein [Mycobacterium paraterrae]UMB68809.1 DUF5994 family protein [Mycobacterium paraterrae]